VAAVAALLNLVKQQVLVAQVEVAQVLQLQQAQQEQQIQAAVAVAVMLLVKQMPMDMLAALA
jgi:hypothetical protein